MAQRLFLWLVLAAGFSCSGLLASEVEEVLPAIQPDPIYDEFFPNDVELCAVSQYRSLAYGEGGILLERDEIIADGFLPLRSLRYLRFSKRYFDYAEARLAEVEAMLARLDEAGGS